ncbi:MAG: N-acetylmuramoyl-L-alanine amidase family protein [Verrucomicrobiales bacterium]
MIPFSPLLLCRRRLLAGCGAGLLAFLASPLLRAWTIVKISDRDYVTAKDIKEFYQFPTLERSGRSVTFRSPRLVMRCRVGSNEVWINNVKFLLSLSVVEQNDEVLISRIDLSKLIDPILRPSHIASAQLFDTVVIDPGHGGHDTGARGTYGFEKTYTLDVGTRLGRLLQSRGIKVKMTRTSDTYPTLPQRVAMANATPNSIFVSVHFNHGQSRAEGIETYALAPQGTSRSRKGENVTDDARFRGNTRDSENIALATAVHASLLYQLRATDRGVMRDRWFVLKGVERPGILVECGFISSPGEGGQVNNPQYRERLAIAIATGIINYRNALRR